MLRLGVDLAVHQRPHAIIVQAAALQEVADRELVLDVGLHVLDLEVVPLGVLGRVEVVAQLQKVVSVGSLGTKNED